MFRKLLKYTFLGVSGVVASASIMVGYKVGQLKRRGAVTDWTDPVYRGLPVFRYRGCTLNSFAAWRFVQYEKFQFREDDVLLVTYPRSGTTRLQEIIFLIMSDLDFNTARNTIIDDRFPYLDMFYPGLKAIDALPSRRLLKTHYPYHLLPPSFHDKKPKIIYSARNPKDIVVSQHHLYKKMSASVHSPTIENTYRAFVSNTAPFAPWSQHVLDFWTRKDDVNILFLTFEEMNQNPNKCIHKLAKFLGKTLTDTDVKLIAEHCRVENMRENKATNFSWLAEKNPYFRTIVNSEDSGWIRTGRIGDWKTHLSPEMSETLDNLVQQTFSGSGLQFQDCDVVNK